ncbi:uncharacterized protein LOC143026809 [Oratosquilla oratoria]|uniref:uncharacterized protein LOC143026809 n=1 Tax=Oratosquilla oratoria TaxID=337810 RepID=UPI003F777B41
MAYILYTNKWQHKYCDNWPQPARIHRWYTSCGFHPINYVNPIVSAESLLAPAVRSEDIEAIENVQRRATKLVPTLKNLSYEECLRKLKIPTLAYRRARGDMLETFKLLSGGYDTEVCQGLFMLRDSDRTRVWCIVHMRADAAHKNLTHTEVVKGDGPIKSYTHS